MRTLKMKRLLFVLLFILVQVPGAGSRACAFEAVNGVMDMSGWEAGSGPVMLNGEWRVAWNRLLTPEALDGSTTGETFTLPGLWPPSRAGMEAMGSATFWLRLSHLPIQTGQAALYIPDILSVGKVWINGHLQAQTGQTGLDRDSEKPLTHALLFYFAREPPELDILIQVSNFHNARGGINLPVWFGPAGAVQNLVGQRRMVTTVISSAFLMIALLHLTLFLIGKTETTHAWFGLYALTWAVQTLFSPAGGSPGNAAVNFLPWNLSIDLTLTACAAGPPLLIMCYHSLFPRPSGKRINRCFQVAGLMFFIYVLLPPSKAYDPICLVYFFFTLAGFAYLFIRLILDLTHRQPRAGLLLPGFGFLIFTVINDILGDNHLIGWPWVSFGLLAFILSYSAYISVSLSRTFAKVRDLNTALQRNSTVSVPGRRAEDKKALLVRVMNLSLDLWTAVTRTSRVELAEQSGLWNVYVGKDGWARTQTLDKYLDISSLPKHPRWKNVVNTADFVLAACSDTDLAMRQELEEALKKFRHVV